MDAPGQTVIRARGLRRRMSLPEVLLWKAVRNRGSGLKVRRQHPVGPFILDFYCAAANLAIEVDGATHHDDVARAHDARREDWLRQHGVEVLRIPARQVLVSVDSAVQQILDAAAAKSSPPGRGDRADRRVGVVERAAQSRQN